jgi:hypothetical protein
MLSFISRKMGNSTSAEPRHEETALRKTKQLDMSTNNQVIIFNTPLKAGLSQQDPADTDTASLVSSLSLASSQRYDAPLEVKPWCGKKFYSDHIREGLAYLNKPTGKVLMLYEAPSSYNTNTSFFNSPSCVFNYHDYPASPVANKTTLSPLKYSVMTGSAYPCYLAGGAPPAGLAEHWQATIPNFAAPSFTETIEADALVNAYLPIDNLPLDQHVNTPHTHYHMAGKDALHLMTSRTTKLLSNTTDVRPCVVKVTHSMGSKGIFIICNDEDENEFRQYLDESGHPNFVVTEFVDIERNVACHFFIHPNRREITWVGCNENLLLPNGNWSSDSTLRGEDQDALRDMQMPYVEDVVKYCESLGFWGFCGIDVLFDKKGVGHLVDVNPRVTGSSPALMIMHLLKEKYGFDNAIFRRSTRYCYPGPAKELFQKIEEHNIANEGRSRVVLLSMYENSETETSLNVAVYGNVMEECQAILNMFAQRKQQ